LPRYLGRLGRRRSNSDMEPRELTILQAQEHLADGSLSAVDLLASVLNQIKSLNPTLNAFITVRPEAEVLDQGRRADRQRREGRPPRLLEGIPVALKDNVETAGIRTTAGSKIFAEWVPDRDATVTRQLEDAGAIIVGKLNMHEFANGPTNDNPHFGRTLNPWDPSRTPGGSSGGSGVALATDMCLGAIGTDTGGSIRTPAAFCGVVGLKPTYGLVSRSGIFPFSWSLDHAGPMARTAEDVGVLLQAIARHDPADPASVRGRSTDVHRDDAAGIVIGVEISYLTSLMGGEVRQTFSRAVDLLQLSGARLEEVRIPRLEVSLAAEVAILFPEAASVHRRFLDERPMDYGADVRRSLLSGRLYGAETYVEAQRVRAVLRRDVAAAFDKVDVLVMPTVIIPPPRWGEESFRVQGRYLDLLNAFIRCTAPFNLTGNPALSLPCGLTSEGLPVGIQLVGPLFSDEKLLRLAHAFEVARGPFEKPTTMQSADARRV
jgi:aspartyl-tRNA(Asn)/glutamyl-tRNA(Gln) amidotransferase subunit A